MLLDIESNPKKEPNYMKKEIMLMLHNIQRFFMKLESLHFAHFFEKKFWKKKMIKIMKMKKQSKSGIIFSTMMLYSHENMNLI